MKEDEAWDKALHSIIEADLNSKEVNNLIKSISKYDRNLAKEGASILASLYAKSIKLGFKVGGIVVQEDIIRRAIGYMLDSKKSRLEIYEFLIDTLDMSEDIVDTIYSEESKKHNIEPMSMSIIYSDIEED